MEDVGLRRMGLCQAKERDGSGLYSERVKDARSRKRSAFLVLWAAGGIGEGSLKRSE